MVEIKHFKQFLHLFFSFQRFCFEVGRSGVGGLNCQPGWVAGCNETTRAHTVAHAIHKLGVYYVKDLGEGNNVRRL